MDLVFAPSEIETWPIEQLRPYARNAKMHGRDQVAKIAASMAKFGWTAPCMVADDGELIAGHGRVLAATMLGLSEVPVIRLGHLDEAERRAYRIADNKLTEMGDWDEAVLRDEIAGLLAEDFDLSLLGIADEDLDALLQDPDDVGAIEGEDDIPETPEDAVSRPGDLWVLENHRLLCGDATVATDVERVLNGTQPLLMATDPPYGVEYDPGWRNQAGAAKTKRTGKVLNDDRADWREAWSLFPGDVAYVWGEDLPDGVAVLTAGVDVQGDRIEVQVIGWGRDEEAWVIDYRVLWGDPSGPRLWADLDGFLSGCYAHPRAVADLPIRAAAIDTGGHHTKMAYEFCRTRLARRIWAIKGRGGPAVPVWPRRPTRTNKGKIPLFIVGVDAVKDAVYARLKIAEPGSGAIHFPSRLDADYFRQLTAERVVTRFHKGRPVRSWQLKRDGERNEALDTIVYASAALQGLISMGMRLNEEVEGMASNSLRSGTEAARIIRSAWMLTST